jgi:hypothetical protein
MNSGEFDPLTDSLIGEAVLSLLKNKEPITTLTLVNKLQAMLTRETDKKRRGAIGRIIDEIRNRVDLRGKKNPLGTSDAKNDWHDHNCLLDSSQQSGTHKIH